MIFQHGFIHADLHPGNILFVPGGRMAVFDLGLVGQLDEENRRRFAFLCYYIVAGMGREVARWLAEQSQRGRVRDYPAYEREVVGVVSEFYDRPYEEVQLTGLIAALYDIMRRHGIRFEATFTVANIALMVIEGLGRKLDPKLNLSRAARPFLESALALSVITQELSSAYGLGGPCPQGCRARGARPQGRVLARDGLAQPHSQGEPRARGALRELDPSRILLPVCAGEASEME
jgi:predicted unusual protein kinase regulating ubiquinone biosynthesis (AarF/ABC1/UbiB family)